MQTRQIVGLSLLPLALLISGATLNVADVGSVVWFCGLLASAVLILALVSFCYNFALSTIPLRNVLPIYIATVVVVGLGEIIRICFHDELDSLRLRQAFGAAPRRTNWAFVIISGLYEWLSFSSVLLCVFLVARRLGGASPPELPGERPTHRAEQIATADRPRDPGSSEFTPPPA
jgi:hypothetical protein